MLRRGEGEMDGVKEGGMVGDGGKGGGGRKDIKQG